MPAPQPFPYQGSKRRIAPAILARLPDGFERLIEPFAGSAAVSLAAAEAGLAQHFVLNDINAPLSALWERIIAEPELLADQYAALWHAQAGQEREFYDRVRAEFNRTGAPHLLLYLLARCVKAAVRYNAAGDFNQSADHRRRGMQPDRMRRDLTRTSALLRDRTDLRATDYQAVLADAGPRDVVYMDPPYQGVSGGRDGRYAAGVAFAEFAATLADLNRRGIAYLVSYDGRTGAKTHGLRLPAHLDLQRIEVEAGRSAQATLLGRAARTVEALYLSPALVAWCGE